MEEFKALLAQERGPVERFVRFRLPSRSDADDVLQEVYLTAFQRFGQFKDQAPSGPGSSAAPEINAMTISGRWPNGWNSPWMPSRSRFSPTPGPAPGSIPQCGRLWSFWGTRKNLYFWKELPQAEIARRLGVPIGTVKSRLHTAKRNFKDRYPCPIKPTQRGKSIKKLPDILPDYTIEPMTESPFPVKWEEWMKMAGPSSGDGSTGITGPSTATASPGASFSPKTSVCWSTGRPMSTCMTALRIISCKRALNS